MSSSTSSSELGVARAAVEPSGTTRPALSFRAIVGLFACAFVLIEALCHLHVLPLSSEYKACWSFPLRARALESSQAVRIAVIGNSAARMGVDPSLLGAEMSRLAAEPVTAERFTVDGSRVTTWRFILERAFLRPGTTVDAVVILFQPGALEDGGDVIAPIAQGLTSVRDWPELFNTHLRTSGERIEFAADSVSAMYASRGRFRDKTLNRVIPGYEGFANELNHAAYEIERTGRTPGSRRAATYESLRALLAAAAAKRVRLVFAVYPETETDPETRRRNLDAMRIVREAQFEVVDLSEGSGRLANHYVDRFHLDPEGAKIFSRQMAAVLAPLVGGRSTGTVAVRQ